jgi:nucleolar protein 56
MGSFISENGQIIASALFPKDAREIARRLASVQDFEVLREEAELARGREGLEVTEKRLAKLGAYIRQPVPFVAPEEHGFDGTLLHDAMLIVAKERARSAVGPDVHLIHAIDALDELARQLNYQLERLREWHGAHFPEFSGLVGDERYVSMLCEGPSRERLSAELGIGGESLGAEASQSDLAAITELAKAARGTIEARASTEAYIRSRARELAPNTCDVVGELLAARIIALAGGLEKLSRMPSSTVQVLGAEKAFFKHIKTGSRPPKHGVLFQHPLVHRAPYWQRGKVARAMAGKAAIAAKVDFHRGKSGASADGLGKDLAAIVEERAKAVGRQFPEAPKRMRIVQSGENAVPSRPYDDRRGGDRRGYGDRRGGGRSGYDRRGEGSRPYGDRGGRPGGGYRGRRDGVRSYIGGGQDRRGGDRGQGAPRGGAGGRSYDRRGHDSRPREGGDRAPEGSGGQPWRGNRRRDDYHPAGRSDGHPDWQKGRRMNRRR